MAGRMVDRAIRPLFDAKVRNDVQVVTTVLSIDGEHDAATVALIAASCAVAISPVRWSGPIAAARIGRVNGEFVLNVTATQLFGKDTPSGRVNPTSDLDLVVAGAPDKLVMVEAGAKEVPEADMLRAMQWGCKELQPVLDLIKKVQSEVGLPKEELSSPDDVMMVADQVKAATRAFVFAQADNMIFDAVKISRQERKELVAALKVAAVAHLTEKGFDADVQEVGLKQIKEYLSEVITKRILDKEERLDGRALTEIRPLTIEVDLLPRVHGSAMFMRGDTQVLSIVTLGAPGDVQTLDTMEEEGTKRYM
ncbi:MAG: polyribonucleotide nucleotidyltransferase, partial [Patescibacteria group bacterium]